MGRLVGLVKKGNTKGVVSKLSGMGVKGLVSLIRGDILLLFSVPRLAWEIDGVRLNATESYFASVIIGVLRQLGSSDKDIYISGRSSILPRVYGRMLTEISLKFAGIIYYLKKVQIAHSQIQLEDGFRDSLN